MASWRLTCPSVPESSSSSSSQTHLTTSARFRARALQARYPASSPRRPAGGLALLSRLPAAFPPPAFASRSSCSRPGIERPSRSADRPEGWTQTGFPRFARTRHDRGGRPLYPGDDGAHPRPATLTGLHPAHHSGTSLHPATTIHQCAAPLDEPSTRVQAIHPSDLPLARDPGWNARPWAFPRASHPAITRSARRGGDRSSSTDLESTLYGIRPNLQPRVIYSMRATSRRTRRTSSLDGGRLRLVVRRLADEYVLQRQRVGLWEGAPRPESTPKRARSLGTMSRGRALSRMPVIPKRGMDAPPNTSRTTGRIRRLPSPR